MPTAEASSHDEGLLRVIAWVTQFRSCHNEHVHTDAGFGAIELDWRTDKKWRALIVGNNSSTGRVHRKCLELCVFPCDGDHKPDLSSPAEPVD